MAGYFKNAGAWYTVDPKPGDLVFYGGGITHVAMYIGDNQIVHAANSNLGIIVSDMTWMNPVAAGTYIE